MESLGFFIIYLGWVLVYSTQLLVLYARYPQAWRWAWQTAKVHKRKTRRKKGRLKPRSPEDCAACRQKIKLKVFRARTDVVPCEATKKKVGRPKTIATEGDGKRGKRQHIQHFKCQACQARFTSRLHPPLYWLRTDEDTVVAVLWLLVEGAPLAVLARFTGHQEATLTRWLERMGIHREKLHNRLFRNLVLKFVQMDELFARVRREGVKWVWFALDPLTKIIPAMHVGDRSNDDAMHLVHDLKSRLRTQGVPPLFTTDGLRSYFYALTAHFGYWHKPARARKLHWAVSTLLTYGQLVKRKTKQVYTETRMLWGQKETLVSQLQAAGYSGQIQTALVERVNLTARRGVSGLMRKTWSYAQTTSHLTLHVAWWRAYYHFVRPHESLAYKDARGRTQRRTPAMAAGLTSRLWTVEEILKMPLQPTKRKIHLGKALPRFLPVGEDQKIDESGGMRFSHRGRTFYAVCASFLAI